MFEVGQPRTRSFYVLSIVFALFVLFLFGPMLVMYILSFQGRSGGMSFPMVGTSLYWFHAVATGTDRMGDIPGAFVRSIRMAVIISLITVTVSVAAGMGFRRRFPGSGVLFYTAVGSIVVPSLFIAFGIALGFRLLGWKVDWWSSGIAAQLTWTLPFGLLIMFVTMGRFPKAYEEAATDLGASSWQRFRDVILPIILPGVIAVAVFGFTLSYDEAGRSGLTIGTKNTLPLEIQALTSGALSPVLFAVGTITTIVSFLVLAVALVAVGLIIRRRTGRKAHVPPPVDDFDAAMAPAE